MLDLPNPVHPGRVGVVDLVAVWVIVGVAHWVHPGRVEVVDLEAAQVTCEGVLLISDQ